MLCSGWKPLKLNTANCAEGRGKMQVSFSHKDSGGAQKTPPLSLGTWPTEGEGYEEALRWYTTVQSTLQPLRGKVGSEDTRVQDIKVKCQQAAKAACARAEEAKVCLVQMAAVGALCSLACHTAYPQILSCLVACLVALLLLAIRVIVLSSPGEAETATR